MKQRSWLFWSVFFFAGFLTLVAALFYLTFRSLRGAVPSIDSGSTVSIDLLQEYPEETFYELGGPFFGVSRLTFRDLVFGIDRAKDDARIDGLLVRVRGTTLGWAQAAELREKLLDFKSSGKSLVAFVEFAGNRDYFVASAADSLYLHPRGVLDLRGIRAELLFLKSTLEKLGVEAEFERIGSYKTAPEMFLRESMSPEGREAVTELVETVHASLVSALAEGRGLGDARARSVMERGPFTAAEAMELGLVDDLLYLDEVTGAVSEKDASDTVSIADYRLGTGTPTVLGVEGRIALIYGLGAIVGGRSDGDSIFGRVMGSDTIAEAFREARQDDSIDAVVFRIDSPGGSDVASDVIWREAMLTREEKPVVVSMANVAASGGYWVATASDAIVAEPLTVTGSIGIYGGKFNLFGLYEKLGMSKDGVSSTANADFFSDYRSFTEEERERLRTLLAAGYEAFLERVSESRGKTTEEVHEIAQGRVWSGRTALALGLVDELGGLEKALSLAKEKAGIADSADVELRVFPEKKSLLEAIVASLLASRARDSSPILALDPERLSARSPLLRLLRSGQPLALMPFRIELY